MFQMLRRFFRTTDAHPWRVIRIALTLALLLVSFLLVYAELFGPPYRGDHATIEFIVTPDQSVSQVAKALSAHGLVRYSFAYHLADVFVRESTIRPGGYRLSQGMDAWTVAKILSQEPYIAWVTVPPGLRKEELGTFLAKELSWTDAELAAWLSLATSSPYGFRDGMFFPDTYLIPSDQTPEQIASRMQGRFEDAVAPYIEEAREKELAWNDIVILASLVERESARTDKPLVAGILWNRLHKGMLLQVDATLQYVTGEPGSWWDAPSPADKAIESPFNTYLNDGLPPAPIASPSLASIEAVLRPERTSCLYYLHDSRGRIHCSPTYAGHVANIDRFLR